MPSREEIRKGIKEHFRSYYCHDSQDWLRIEEATSALLSYLHSQGVVIKVDRELPLLNNDDNPLEYLARKSEQRNMLKAGYTAVESLI